MSAQRGVLQFPGFSLLNALYPCIYLLQIKSYGSSLSIDTKISTNHPHMTSLWGHNASMLRKIGKYSERAYRIGQNLFFSQKNHRNMQFSPEVFAKWISFINPPHPEEVGLENFWVGMCRPRFESMVSGTDFLAWNWSFANKFLLKFMSQELKFSQNQWKLGSKMHNFSKNISRVSGAGKRLEIVSLRS